MTALLLGAAWGSLVLAAAWRRRPTRERVSELVGVPSPKDARRGQALPLAAERLGRCLASLVRRPPDVARDRMVGTAALAGVAAAVMSPWWSVLAVAAVTGAGKIMARRRRAKDLDRVVDELPEVVDLFVLAAGSGLNVALAVQAVARFASGRMGVALAEVEQVRLRGGRLADALDRLPEVVGEPVRPLAVALAGAERYGTPLVPALETLAADVRRQRRRRAEYSARQAPVKLIFPLVLCALPAFALLTVVPLLLATLRSLHH